jgi:hypothetical protein
MFMIVANFMFMKVIAKLTPLRLVPKDLLWHCISNCSAGPRRRGKRRVYQPRVVGGQIMIQDDLERLHKNMLEHIADE